MSAVAKSSKEAVADQPGFFASLFQGRLYKPTQGRVVRQVTALAVGVIALLGAYQFSHSPTIVRLGKWIGEKAGWESFYSWRYLIMLALAAVGCWLAFRVVNFPKFADFLIAVEAEMKKVSWPSGAELWRASVVVMFVIFAMAALLFMFDLVWSWFFRMIGIRHG